MSQPAVPTQHHLFSSPRHAAPPPLLSSPLRLQRERPEPCTVAQDGGTGRRRTVRGAAAGVEVLRHRVLPRRARRLSIHQVRASKASRGAKFPSDDVIMVDPLEAKRLAAKQMQEIQAKQKFKRQRQIEAINGAWAMIGLTAGLVIEGQTGESILGQLAGYWSAIVSFFIR